MSRRKRITVVHLINEGKFAKHAGLIVTAFTTLATFIVAFVNCHMLEQMKTQNSQTQAALELTSRQFESSIKPQIAFSFNETVSSNFQLENIGGVDIADIELVGLSRFSKITSAESPELSGLAADIRLVGPYRIADSIGTNERISVSFSTPEKDMPCRYTADDSPAYESFIEHSTNRTYLYCFILRYRRAVDKEPFILPVIYSLKFETTMFHRYPYISTTGSGMIAWNYAGQKDRETAIKLMRDSFDSDDLKNHVPSDSPRQIK